jgi:hypothetical protein
VAFADKPPRETCCICGGNVPIWMDGNATTAHTNWGDFTVYYHPVCYNKKVVEEKLRNIVKSRRK